MVKRNKITHIGDYSAGHPWYYVLGNEPLSVKEIKHKVLKDSYRGYRKDEIMQIDRQSEPLRSHNLQKIRQEVIQDLKESISGYRQCALALNRLICRIVFLDEELRCYDEHTNISLVYSHLYNHFAHLALLDELDTQLDMFA
jgi:hypothetical protein